MSKKKIVLIITNILLILLNVYILIGVCVGVNLADYVVEPSPFEKELAIGIYSLLIISFDLLCNFIVNILFRKDKTKVSFLKLLLFYMSLIIVILIFAYNS